MSHKSRSSKKSYNRKNRCESSSDSCEEHYGSRRDHCNKSKCDCEPTPINHVPYTITKSGRYCVAKNLTYNGVEAAITIATNDVSIDLNFHKLLLTSGAATGILVQNPTIDELLQNIEILNGTIGLTQGTLPIAATSIAISLNNVVKAHVDNVLTHNTFRGIVGVLSSSILIENSTQVNHTNNPDNLLASAQSIRMLNSNNIIIKNDNVSAVQNTLISTSNVVGFVFIGTSNVIIEDVNMIDIDIGIGAILSDNLNIDKLNVELSPLSNASFMQLGAGGGTPCTNTIIRNSNFISRPTEPTAVGLDGLYLIEGKNLLIENVVILTKSTPFEAGIIAGAIHIGSSPNIFTDVKIINTVVSGSNVDAIVVELGSNITLDNVVVSEALENNIRLINARNVTIKNSDIQAGTTNGINVEVGSQCNTISNTNIRDNGLGLLISGNNNITRDSNIYCNTTNIKDIGLNNQFVNNTVLVAV